MTPDKDLRVILFGGEACVYVYEGSEEAGPLVTPAGTASVSVPANWIVKYIKSATPTVTTVRIVGADSRLPRTVEEFEQWLNGELAKG